MERILTIGSYAYIALIEEWLEKLGYRKNLTSNGGNMLVVWVEDKSFCIYSHAQYMPDSAQYLGAVEFQKKFQL